MSATEIMRIQREIKSIFDTKVQLFFSDTPNQYPVFTIVSIQVPAMMRRQGVGSMVLEHILREADCFGWDVDLDASERLGTPTSVLIDFYERFGFELTGEYNSHGEPTMFRKCRR